MDKEEVYNNGYKAGVLIAEEIKNKIIIEFNIRKNSNEFFNNGFIDAVDDIVMSLRDNLEEITKEKKDD